MVNINFGDKIIDSCIKEKCPAYKVILALSNNADLKSAIRCPQIFCNRMRQEKYICDICGENKDIYQGYFENEKFRCYKCKEMTVPEAYDTETDADVEINKELIKQKLDKLSFHFNKISKNEKFSKFYFDAKESLINFYNPMEMNQGVLTISYRTIERDSIQDLIKTLSEFFKSFLDKDKKSSCEGCFYEQWSPSHMTCIDCSRNDQSAATLRRDRYNEKK
jgi:hypothetical protein